MPESAGYSRPPSPSLRRRVFELAWPVILENLLQTMLGIVDTLMVGRLGADALAGVGTAQQLLFFLIAILSAVSIGSSVIAAHAIGAKDTGTASKIAKQSIIWALLLAVPLATLGAIFARNLIAVMGVTDAVALIGGDYLRVTMLAGVFLVVPFTVGAVLRGAGDTRTPLAATTIANLVNAVVAYLLIFGALGAPALGPVGSAWGAAAGRLVSCVILLVALYRGRLGFSIRGRLGWRPESGLARRVIALGAPAALEQIATSAGFLLMTVFVAELGTDALAASRVVGNVLGISLLPGFGFGIAATALVGQSLGAATPEDGEAATGIATQWALVWMGILGAFFIVLRTPLSAAFTSDQTVVQIAADCMIPLGLTQPLWAISFVNAGGLRGAGNTRYPLAMTIVGIWGTTALSVVTIGVLHLGLAYVWGGFLVFSPIASYLTWRRFKRGDWKATRLAPAPLPAAAG
ncbi:MAG TPA: MATE family efflux transporter [Chloroflexota bacterium]|nr:MATE family efflux transporter [Chloroflexota bacterium]